MVKSRNVTKKEIEYYDVCPKCQKEIKGTAEGQVIYNMKLHLNSHEDENKKQNKRRKTTNKRNGRKYYTTRREALMARRKGDRIYYDAFKGAYYIARTSSKKSFWDKW